MKFVSVPPIKPHTESYMPNCSGCLLTAVKLKLKNMSRVAYMLFYIL